MFWSGGIDRRRVRVGAIDNKWSRVSDRAHRVEISFYLRTGVAGIDATVEHHFRIVGAQAEGSAETAQVGELNIRLANHRDALAGSLEASLIERRRIQNGGPNPAEQIKDWSRS